MIKEAKTITLMIPYRNYDLEALRIAMKLMDRQTHPFDEFVVSDFASVEPYKSEMKEICDEFGIKRIYTEISADDKIIDVHLWQMCYNIGIRAATSDLILVTGIDRVYEERIAEAFLWYYNTGVRQTKRDQVILGTCVKIHRTPSIEEFGDFDKIAAEGKCRGGLGALCASKDYWHKIHGIDETIRWYADNDFYGRSRRGKVGIRWINRFRGQIPQTRIIHTRTHMASRKRHGGYDVLEITRRGKRFINKHVPNRKVIRNDENWGIFTEEKLLRAIRQSQWTKEDMEESSRVWQEDKARWHEIYADNWGFDRA